MRTKNHRCGNCKKVITAKQSIDRNSCTECDMGKFSDTVDSTIELKECLRGHRVYTDKHYCPNTKDPIPEHHTCGQELVPV